MEGCEWNPEANALAKEGDTHNATEQAIWSIGTGKRNLHVCDACAALPVFKRLRRRDALHPCVECGYPLRETGLCGECACEDDGDIW